MDSRSEAVVDNPGMKRKRTIKAKPVTIACMRCRETKLACDGKQPCTRCVNRNAQHCEYAQDVEAGESRHGAVRRQLRASQQLNEDFAQAARFLKSLPDEDIISVIDSIRAADDPAQALASIHVPAVPRRAVLLNYRANRSTFPPTTSDLAYELALTHKSSFPILVPYDQSLLPVDFTPGTVHSGYGWTRHAHGTQQQSLSSDSNQSNTDNVLGPIPSPTILEPNLRSLDMAFWTGVVIHNEEAAAMISNYLLSDHPLLGWFDADLFLLSLCGCSQDYCSPLLVSALFAWICQRYNDISPQSTLPLAGRFLDEAQERWQAVQDEDTILNVASCMILSLASATLCEDAQSRSFKDAGAAMGERLGLFNVDKVSEYRIGLQTGITSANDLRARGHIAWGAYNWICLHAHFYNGEPAHIPPGYPTPSNHKTYMGDTFSAICHFRVIVAGFTKVYNSQDKPTLAFAEETFHRLLAWADVLNTQQRRNMGMPHHVSHLHIWYHTTIIDLFRPFLSKQIRLQTFAASRGSPDDIYDASLSQLKCLAVIHIRSYPSTQHCALWHLALMYLGNHIATTTLTADSAFYWQCILQSYFTLARNYRVAVGLLQSMVMLAVKNRFLDESGARKILRRLDSETSSNHMPGTQSSTHIVDLKTALEDKYAAQLDAVTVDVEALLLSEHN